MLKKIKVLMMGQKIRIDRCDKGTTEIMANVTDANDNAPISYALAA